MSLFPQLGSSAIGGYLATKCQPLCHFTSVFYWSSEQHIRQYWPQVPVYYLEQKDDFPIEKFLQDGPVELIVAGYPAAFVRGTLKRLNARDGSFMKTEEQMLYSALKLMLEKVQPKVILGEFSLALFNPTGINIMQDMGEIAHRFNYSFSVTRSSPEYHGIPQKNARVIYNFWKSETVPRPIYVLDKAPSVATFLSQIPNWAPHQSEFVTKGKVTDRYPPYVYVLNRESLSHQEFVEKFVLLGTLSVAQYLNKRNLLQVCAAWTQINYPNVSWGKTSFDRKFPQSLMKIQERIHNKLGFYDDSPKFINHISPAVSNKTAMFLVHPRVDRFLNLRELLHLSGFPHDFEMISAEKNWKYICAATPVKIVQCYVSQALEFCQGNRELSSYSFLKIDNTTRCVLSNKPAVSPTDNETSCNNCASSHDTSQEFPKEMLEILNDNVPAQSPIRGDRSSNDPYLPVTLPSPLPSVEQSETLLEISLDDIQPSFLMSEDIDVLSILNM